jgi:diguanylate cyclase (GGDEF)-like protein/PAS domain S-box-containing protein
VRATSVLSHPSSSHPGLDPLPEVFWVLAPAGDRFSFLGPTAQAVWGRPAESLAGAPADRLQWVHEEDRERLAAALRALPEHGYELEYRVFWIDGGVHWLRERAFPVRGADGAVAHVCGLTTDLTTHLSGAEEHLIELRRFRLMAEKSADIVALLDAAGNIFYLSESIEHVTGWQREDWLDANIADRVHVDERSYMLHRLGEIGRSIGLGRTDTFRIKHRDGHWIWCEGTASNLLQEPEVHAIVLNFRDITARKRLEDEVTTLTVQLEQQVNERTRALEEANARLYEVSEKQRVMLAAMPDTVFTIDRQGQFLDVQGNSTHLTAQPESIRGRHITEVGFDSQVAKELMQAVLQALNTGEVQVVEYEMNLPSGRHNFEARVKPYRQHEVLALVRETSNFSQTIEFHRRLAEIDPLTGLRNRAGFERALAEALTPAQENLVAVLSCDLDGFKTVNDTLGHAAGDSVLMMLGARLRTLSDASLTVARVGGDEFAAVLRAGTTPELNDACHTVAQRIIDVVKLPYQLAEKRIRVSASVGIAMYPRDGRDFSTLMRHADVAMYEAKSRGDGFAFFGSRLSSMVGRSLRNEIELRRMIESDRLMPWFEPQVEASTGRIAGWEMLVRDRGDSDVTHARLMALIEQVDLAHEFGLWMLSQARRYAVQLSEHEPGVAIRVNLPPKLLCHEVFLRGMREDLRAGQIQGDRLVLEISTLSELPQPDRAKEVCGSLADLGVRISLDEFGVVGYGLEMLRVLPVAEIKLVRNLVQGITGAPRDRMFIEALVRMAHSCNVFVAASGVSDRAQAEQLAAMGVTRIQGPYVGPAAPWEEVMGAQPGADADGVAAPSAC